MAGALDPAAYIHEGFWTDWSKGKISGLTWTLCPNKATLLTNSLALFVTLAGGQLWTIIRFALHQRRVSQTSRNASECQAEEQVVLRNTATDLHTMRLMAQVAWTTRRNTGRVFSYSLAIACLAILHYTFFLVAGTFSNKLVNPNSNKLVSPSSNVLSRSPHCGVWSSAYLNTANSFTIDPSSLETVRSTQQYLSSIDHSVQLSLEYAQACYQSDSTYYMSSKCDTLPKARLETEQKGSNESCPFGPRMCHGDKTVVFETGAIDSHRDLGINAPIQDRLVYRRRTSCAVLNDTDRVIESNESTSEAMARAYYGHSILEDTNYTYSFSNFSSLYTEFTTMSTNPYLVNTQIAFGLSPRTKNFDLFVPLPEFDRTAADLHLFFLSFTGRYFEPIDDPWFSAHQLQLFDTISPIARKQYTRDRLVSTLGCKEQHQFCNPNGRCTPFLGWGQVQDVMFFNAGLSAHQNVTFDRMLRAAFGSSLGQVVGSLARTKTPLIATDQAVTKETVLSLKLPNNQWELELKFWHSIAMAQLQRTIVQWSTGQIAPDPETQLVRPGTEADSWFCKNLIIPSTVYQSFSILYLVLILTIGTLVILVSWNVEKISGWLQFRSTKGLSLKRIWDDDHMLGLKMSTQRTSWKPRPPPKDYAPRAPPARVASYPKSMNQDTAGPLYHNLTVDDRIRQPRFLRFHAPAPADTKTWKHDPESLITRPTTPRLWSQLPREPVRDSWVETDQGYEYRAAEIPNQFPRHSTKTSLAPAPSSRSGRALELADLRAHALARVRNP